MRYIVVIEKADKDYGAYVPDLPDYVAVGETGEEVLRLIRCLEFCDHQTKMPAPRFGVLQV
ncbi:MAG: type II toxin-antitoxin system HicB family antitoxin [Candidatus Neomarinimicrobiota bacterium]